MAKVAKDELLALLDHVGTQLPVSMKAREPFDLMVAKIRAEGLEGDAPVAPSSTPAEKADGRDGDVVAAQIIEALADKIDRSIETAGRLRRDQVQGILGEVKRLEVSIAGVRIAGMPVSLVDMDEKFTEVIDRLEDLDSRLDEHAELRADDEYPEAVRFAIEGSVTSGRIFVRASIAERAEWERAIDYLTRGLEFLRYADEGSRISQRFSD
jgi:hypothetical protein